MLQWHDDERERHTENNTYSLRKKRSPPMLNENLSIMWNDLRAENHQNAAWVNTSCKNYR
jgi:hypothetical protein